MSLSTIDEPDCIHLCSKMRRILPASNHSLRLTLENADAILKLISTGRKKVPGIKLGPEFVFETCRKRKVEHSCSKVLQSGAAPESKRGGNHVVGALEASTNRAGGVYCSLSSG